MVTNLTDSEVECGPRLRVTLEILSTSFFLVAGLNVKTRKMMMPWKMLSRFMTMIRASEARSSSPESHQAKISTDHVKPMATKSLP